MQNGTGMGLNDVRDQIEDEDQLLGWGPRSEN